MRSRIGANPFSLADPDETIDRIVRFLRTHSERIGARHLVVGMSGGLDSSVTAVLCAKALGGKSTLGLCLPEAETRTPRSIQDAGEVAGKFGISFKTLDMTSLVHAASNLLHPSKKNDSVVPYGNLKARLRAMILYYFANTRKGLVVGTGDKSEIMLGYFCYDTSTRVLTRTSLKDYASLSVGDVVFTLNPHNGLVEEVPVTGVYRFLYSGDMIRFKGRHTDLLVTPNHNILVKNRDGRIGFRRADSLADSYHFRLPWSGGWLGNSAISVPPTVPNDVDLSDFFYITGVYLGGGWTGSTDVTVNTKGHSRIEVVNNRGADGRFRKFDEEYRPTTYPGFSTVFAIPAEDRARHRLEKVLDRNNIRFGSYAHVIKISGRKWTETFQPCGTSASTKHVPPWMLRFPADRLRHLFDGMMDSDGSSDGGAYHTISEKLALDLVELCAKLGLQATIHLRPPRTRQYKEKRIVGGLSYEITLAKGPTSLFPKKFGNAAVESYSGVVWCPDVPPWHNLLVERNGAFTFCGNTKYGDGACDIQPIADLYKSSVRHLAVHLGLPRRIFSKPSSPELWPGQIAEDELGLPYVKLDSILWRLERWSPPKEISAELGIPMRMVARVRDRWLQSEHKRRPSLAIKLGFRTAGQDLRIPYSL
ncbi:MAG TPA: NAD(+) synthase [Candidatus Angelobacter sp.]|nr:NAD(+) synthase [Candidatus Angelobacter sp.]